MPTFVELNSKKLPYTGVRILMQAKAQCQSALLLNLFDFPITGSNFESRILENQNNLLATIAYSYFLAKKPKDIGEAVRLEKRHSESIRMVTKALDVYHPEGSDAIFLNIITGAAIKALQQKLSKEETFAARDLANACYQDMVKVNFKVDGNAPSAEMARYLGVMIEGYGPFTFYSGTNISDEQLDLQVKTNSEYVSDCAPDTKLVITCLTMELALNIFRSSIKLNGWEEEDSLPLVPLITLCESFEEWDKPEDAPAERIFNAITKIAKYQNNTFQMQFRNVLSTSLDDHKIDLALINAMDDDY